MTNSTNLELIHVHAFTIRHMQYTYTRVLRQEVGQPQKFIEFYSPLARGEELISGRSSMGSLMSRDPTAFS